MSDEPTYPDQLTVAPLSRPPRATVRVPGSKSITNRALVLAALASRDGDGELRGALRSEDTEVMVEALRALGFGVEPEWDAAVVRLRRSGAARVIPADAADLFTANSGTSMRFLTALVALGPGRYRLDGVSRMRERPIEDLLAALRQLGVTAESERGNGRPPVLIRSDGLRGGRVAVRGDVSSQFLSGLLLAAPYAQGDLTIEVQGPLVSRPYVDLTTGMMRQFGVRLDDDAPSVFHVPGGQSYCAQAYQVEPDASAASYFWGAAAVTGGEIAVAGLTPRSRQGDVRFVQVLERMGCSVQSQEGTGFLVVRGGPLRGVDEDMNDISDTVMTLAAVACFAQGPTTIRNVAHIRHKETDRLAALAAELRRLGAEVVERPDGLTIRPRPLRGAAVDTYNDHRMAMSLALVGLRVPGVVINHPACVAKTYPHFFRDLERLRSPGDTDP
jgi:3-phosphoshikimate 1-carboxyvinyltransferase